MEVWDLYDINRNLTGRDWIRGNPIPDGFFHLVVHVWIKNNDGKFLISQRSETRKKQPLLWECVGGSVLKGETSLEGAIREVKEEVGIDLSNCPGKIVCTKFRKTFDGKPFNDIVDIWLFEYDGNVDLNNATTDEVKQTKWLDKSEVKELFDTGELVPTLIYFFDEIE